MPANPKYIEKSAWQKFAKLTAAIVGGYTISALFHMVLALSVPYPKEVLVTSSITIYILWVLLMLIPYFFRNGWKVWGLYVLIAIILRIFYYFLDKQNPFV